MKKKIAADLTSLAHRVLQLKNKNDVTELQSIAKELYEKLTVLAFTEKHFADAQPNAGSREIEERLEKAYAEAKDDVDKVSNQVEEVMEGAQDKANEAFANNDLSDLFVSAEEDEREEMDLPGISTIQKMVVEMPDEVPDASDYANNDSNSNDQLEEDLEKEESKEPTFERVIPLSDAGNTLIENPTDASKEPENKEKASWEKLIDKVKNENSSAKKESNIDHPEDRPEKKSVKNDFDEITADFKETPIFERKVNDSSERPKSLNERLNQGMKIGMNDRLGFVKHLFNGSTDDFNRVLSQLNTFPTYDKADHFIENIVKPEYNNWEGKDAHADKFKELIARNYS